MFFVGIIIRIMFMRNCFVALLSKIEDRNNYLLWFYWMLKVITTSLVTFPEPRFNYCANIIKSLVIGNIMSTIYNSTTWIVTVTRYIVGSILFVIINTSSNCGFNFRKPLKTKSCNDIRNHSFLRSVITKMTLNNKDDWFQNKF